MYEQARVERAEHDDVVILRAIGEFDMACIDTLRTAFGGALVDHQHVVLDLSGTTFLDSTGLSAIVAARKQATESGGWLRVANPRPNVQKLLAITALDDYLGVHATVSDALRAGTGADA